MKAFRPYFIIIALGFILFAVWSCGDSQDDKEELDIDAQVRLVVDEKLATRKTQGTKKCRDAALKEAEEMVDSMLMAQAKLSISDTLGKPPKPPKPELLEVKKAKDNTPIKPLFDEKAIEENTVKVESSKTKTIQQQ